MRMSCNGCRILRKGCSPNCILRPCLQWIPSPESQSNATLFLAKFYGRAGLINLINAGPVHLHQEIFKSLMYEACGRIINPVLGATGLMNSGEWDRCQSAVNAVLQGSPIMMQVSREDGFETEQRLQLKLPLPLQLHPVHGCDIRHVYRGAAADLRRVRIRNRCKRLGTPATSKIMNSQSQEKFTITGWELTGDYNSFPPEFKIDETHEDSFSIETVEPTLVNPIPAAELRVKSEAPPPCDIGLELTLGRNLFL